MSCYELLKNESILTHPIDQLFSDSNSDIPYIKNTQTSYQSFSDQKFPSLLSIDSCISKSEFFYSDILIANALDYNIKDNLFFLEENDDCISSTTSIKSSFKSDKNNYDIGTPNNTLLEGSTQDQSRISVENSFSPYNPSKIGEVKENKLQFELKNKYSENNKKINFNFLTATSNSEFKNEKSFLFSDDIGNFSSSFDCSELNRVFTNTNQSKIDILPQKVDYNFLLKYSSLYKNSKFLKNKLNYARLSRNLLNTSLNSSDFDNKNSKLDNNNLKESSNLLKFIKSKKNLPKKIIRNPKTTNFNLVGDKKIINPSSFNSQSKKAKIIVKNNNKKYEVKEALALNQNNCSIVGLADGKNSKKNKKIGMVGENSEVNSLDKNNSISKTKNNKKSNSDLKNKLSEFLGQRFLNTEKINNNYTLKIEIKNLQFEVYNRISKIRKLN